MPLLHTENAEDCQLGIDVLDQIIHFLKNQQNSDDLVKLFQLISKWGNGHLDILKEFGRFPQRNKVLGRESTPEEEIFLQDASGLNETL